MPFGGSDALEQTIRLLIEVAGTEAGDQLASLLAKLRQEQKLAAEAMRDAKAPADEMVKTIGQYESTIQRLGRALTEFRRQQADSNEALEATLVPLAKVELAAANMTEVIENRAAKAFAKLAKEIEAAAKSQDGTILKSTNSLIDSVEREISEFDRSIKKKREAVDVVDSMSAATDRLVEEIQAELRLYELQEQSVADLAALKARAWAADRMATEQRSAAREREAGQAQWLSRQERDLAEAMQSMHEHESTASAARVGLTQTTERATRETDKHGRSILNVAHALQDAQYGVGAVLNNIPLLADGFGVSAKTAGQLTIAAVGLNLAWEHGAPLIREYASMIGLVDDKTKGAAVTVDEAKTKLDALSAKRVKLDVDFENIARAKEELDALTAARSAYESTKKSDPEKELASDAKSVVEGFGGSKTFADAIEAREQESMGSFSRTEPSDPEFKRYQLLKQRYDYYKASEATDPAAKGMAEMTLGYMNEIEAAAKAKRRTSIETEVGAFAEGNESVSGDMVRRAMAGWFNQVGAGGLTGNEALMNLRGAEFDPNGKFMGVNRTTMQRRLDSDAEARLDDETNDANLKAFKDARRAREERQKELDRIRDRDALAQDAEEAGARRIEEADAKHAAAVFETGLKEAGKADHQRRMDEARAAKAAPKEAKAAKESELSDLFRRRTGATEDQSEWAGKEMARLVDMGLTTEQAGAVAQNKLIGMLNSHQATLARIQANQEMLGGIVGPATMRLAQIEAAAEQTAMNLRMIQGAVRTQRPSRLQRGN